MHKSTTPVLLLALTSPILAALNGACSVNGVPGVCLHTADCTSGGTSTPGFCPDDPADVKCCTKASCSSNGSCQWTSACSGTTLSGQCPGPSGFKCCVPSPAGPSQAHELSSHGAEFIAGFEGFRADFYRDAADVLTIGYGHACQPDSECDGIDAPITEAEGQDLLKSDAKAFVDCVNEEVTVPLNQNQFDALVSFTYNLGCGNLEDIAVYLNKNDFSGATSAMKEYVHAGGQVLQGLVRRRNEEVELFNS